MKITDAAQFGKELRNRRKAMGYTQKDISDFTGFSISFIVDLEKGKTTIELGKALHIANILGLDIELNER